MSIPPEFFSTELNAVEFKTVVALYHLADRRMLVEATTEELSILTGYSTESLRRAFRGLEKSGLLATTRTKRNWGKLSRNKYTLLLPSHKLVEIEDESSHSPVGWKVLSPHNLVGSTGGTTWLRNTNSLTSINENTTYSLKSTEGEFEKKEESMEKWRPRGEDTTGDDEIGGFGLFEDEVPAAVKPSISTNKRDTRTRGRRPEFEWTPNDVAAEFAFQLGRRFPYIPGLISVRELRGALAKYRSQHGTTADIEMEIQRMFFEDQRNWQNAEKNPKDIHRKYLAMFRTHMTQAYERLSLDSPIFIEEEVRKENFVYASDGRKFENSFLGQKRLAQYEEKLKESHDNA
jgi:hypothetical protein